MSKPSTKRRKRVKPKGPRNREDPGADQFRKMVRGLLVGVKGWGMSLEAMTRQKYSPAAMQSIVSDYMQMFTIMTQLTRVAANLKVEGEEAILQPSLLNAANVLTFFQGPVLDGVLQERDPGTVLTEFVEIVNQQFKENSDDGTIPPLDVPSGDSPSEADQDAGTVDCETYLRDKEAQHGEEDDEGY